MGEVGDSLSDAVSKAVEEWLATNGGGMATGYSMVLNYFDNKGTQSWATAHADGQSPAHTLGLMRWLTLSIEHGINCYFDREDER